MAWARILDESLGGNLVREQVSVVKHLFKYCPLCGGRDSIELFMPGLGKDRIACADCGAIWHLKFSGLTGGLSWAKLEKTSVDGRGRELLGAHEKAELWQNMAIAAKRQSEAKYSPTVVQREVTINREIVKIPCDHCGALIDETGNFCSHCGAPRSGLKFQNPRSFRKFCSNCGNEIVGSAVFCAKCGSKIL